MGHFLCLLFLSHLPFHFFSPTKKQKINWVRNKYVNISVLSITNVSPTFHSLNKGYRRQGQCILFSVVFTPSPSRHHERVHSHSIPLSDISGFSRFLVNESLRRTGLHWSLSAKSSFDNPVFEISCSHGCRLSVWVQPVISLLLTNTESRAWAS